MIRSTHPEFEKLVSGEATKSSKELVGFLNEIGLSYLTEGDLIRLHDDVELLNQETIFNELRQAAHKKLLDELDFEIHRVTGSTNDLVMSRLSNAACKSVFCTAEMQTAGKGRRGRRWVSPFGRNLYITYGRFIQKELSALGGLSMIIGMELAGLLRSVGLERVGLKWPNDILLDGGKLGGILVELRPADTRGVGVVAGVGLNLALDEDQAAEIDQSWSVAGEECRLSRNRLLGQVCGRMATALDKFDREGFEPFAENWKQYNLFAGREVTVIRGNETSSGIDAGVDLDGNLLLEVDGEVVTHNSGEVSLRLATSG